MTKFKPPAVGDEIVFFEGTHCDPILYLGTVLFVAPASVCVTSLHGPLWVPFERIVVPCEDDPPKKRGRKRRLGHV